MTRTAEAVTLELHVVPGADRTVFAGRHDGRLRVRVKAPPVDGRANRELLRFLAEAYGVPRSRVAIVAGTGGRSKRVRIDQPRRRPAEAQET